MTLRVDADVVKMAEGYSGVVYGMPREAVALGAVDTSLALSEIPAAIMNDAGF